MKNISITFLVHQPVSLGRYRFFDIGNNSYYYDDYYNENKIRILTNECYLPNNFILLNLLTKYKGRFKASFSISGTSIDLFSLYAPEVLQSFRRLASEGGIEFLTETYSHSLASLKNIHEFRRQVYFHAKKIEEVFGNRPLVFHDTELIYSDRIGEQASEMGFKSILAEVPDSLLNQQGQNYLYSNPYNPEVKILFRNSNLSHEAAHILSNPEHKSKTDLTENFLSLLNKIPDNENSVNLCIDYEVVHNMKKSYRGKDDLFESFLGGIAESSEFCLKTLSELTEENQTVSEISIPDILVRADNFASLAKLQGNELQQEALEKLYNLRYRINPDKEPDLWKDWQYLQSSDNFYYMSSRFFSKDHADHQLNPYDNPYEAFINYMNVLCDFTFRVNNMPSGEIELTPFATKSKMKIAAVS